MRLLKLVVVVILAAVVALVGYAYFGDMEPRQREVRVPVTDAAPAAGDTAATDSETDADNE